ncbi:extensin family protein [Microvirga aerilata]|uniref:extensin family protein n=1 Tax=Microvirga aerilata TaxID=670292 RepID=UPI003632EFD3
MPLAMGSMSWGSSSPSGAAGDQRTFCGFPESAFQAAVQKAACPIFTTVLGPGSDAAHGDHLHLDLRQRKGDYRICQ